MILKADKANHINGMLFIGLSVRHISCHIPEWSANEGKKKCGKI